MTWTKPAGSRHLAWLPQMTDAGPLLDTVLVVVLALLLASGAMVLLRMARGPSTLDRAVALDALVAVVMAGIGVQSAVQHNGHYLPALLVLSFLGFTGSVGVARFMALRDEAGTEDADRNTATRTDTRTGAGTGAEPAAGRRAPTEPPTVPGTDPRGDASALTHPTETPESDTRPGPSEPGPPDAGSAEPETPERGPADRRDQPPDGGELAGPTTDRPTTDRPDTDGPDTDAGGASEGGSR